MGLNTDVGMDVVMILFLLTLVTIFVAGFVFGQSEKNSTTYILLLCGIFCVMLSFSFFYNCAKEKIIREYLNNEITYDTLAIDKNGKILEIKINDN